MRITAAQRRYLITFRGTGLYVGRDARPVSHHAKPWMKLAVLLRLRSNGLLEYAAAGRWYLTDAGRDVIA